MEIKEEEIWELVKKLPAYQELLSKTPKLDVLDLLKKDIESDEIIKKIIELKLKEID